MSLLTRLRWVFARRPMLWWVLVVALAVGAGALTTRAVRRVDEARHTWGTARQVWIASADIGPGEPVVAVVRDFPEAMVPAAAVTTAPLDVIARQRLRAGEVIVVDDLTARGVAGLMAPGSIAVAVPMRAGSYLRVGDHAAAFANGQRLANGVIVGTDDEQIVIAVPADDATELTLAVPGGGVIIGLVP